MDECVTVSYGKVKGKAKQYQYRQPARYERKKLKNGKTVWAYVGHMGTARRSPDLATKDARRIAEENNLLFVRGVRHNNPA